MAICFIFHLYIVFPLFYILVSFVLCWYFNLYFVIIAYTFPPSSHSIVILFWVFQCFSSYFFWLFSVFLSFKLFYALLILFAINSNIQLALVAFIPLLIAGSLLCHDFRRHDFSDNSGLFQNCRIIDFTKDFKI